MKEYNTKKSIFNLNKGAVKIPTTFPGFIKNHLESLKILSSGHVYTKEKERNKLLFISCIILFILATIII